MSRSRRNFEGLGSGRIIAPPGFPIELTEYGDKLRIGPQDTGPDLDVNRVEDLVELLEGWLEEQEDAAAAAGGEGDDDDDDDDDQELEDDEADR
jgi:hypothetical protein